jgi:hypothetical protein
MLTGNFYRDIAAIRNTKDAMLLAQWAKELAEEKVVVEQIKNKKEKWWIETIFFPKQELVVFSL